MFDQQFQSSSGNWNSSTRYRTSYSQEHNVGQGSRADNTKITKIAPRITVPNRLSEGTKDQTLRRSNQPFAFCCFLCSEPEHSQTTFPNQARRGLLIKEINPSSDYYYDENEEIDLANNTELEGDTYPPLVA